MNTDVIRNELTRLEEERNFAFAVLYLSLLGLLAFGLVLLL